MSAPVVIASNNRKKIAELEAILSRSNWTCVPQSALAITEAEETATTFVGNALLKAHHAAQSSGQAAIADDSGICVPALNNAPGVYSARYAGTHGDDDANTAKLLHAMAEQDDRRAFYVCAIAFFRAPDDPLPLIAQGLWQGELLRAPRGTGGFGYDPVFYLPEEACTAAELTAARKNAISHRARALRTLSAMLAESGSTL